MNVNETCDILNKMAASDSKVQIWMILNGNCVELEHDRRPMFAADALVSAKAAHDTAKSLGLEPEFHLRRWEQWAY